MTKSGGAACRVDRIRALATRTDRWGGGTRKTILEIGHLRRKGEVDMPKREVLCLCTHGLPSPPGTASGQSSAHWLVPKKSPGHEAQKSSRCNFGQTRTLGRIARDKVTTVEGSQVEEVILSLESLMPQVRRAEISISLLFLEVKANRSIWKSQPISQRSTWLVLGLRVWRALILTR